MLEALAKALPPPARAEPEDAGDAPLAVAIVGRPNVGKSSLLNAVVGEERSIVCDLSGTTRDAVDTPVTLPCGTRVTLIDTAGIRKRARVAGSKDGAESISVDRAVRAIGRAEVVALVVDATEGVTQQV
jgi:GTP-binding protein